MIDIEKLYFTNKNKLDWNYIDKQKYKATVVVRSAEDNNLYLYDIIDIKK